jgi:hypothetical protein
VTRSLHTALMECERLQAEYPGGRFAVVCDEYGYYVIETLGLPYATESIRLPVGEQPGETRDVLPDIHA